MNTNTHFWSFLAQLFLKWEMLQTKVAENIKTHVLCSVTFLRKLCPLWDNMEKYCRAGQATDGNMVHAHYMLDTQGYKHTPITCIFFSFLLQQWLRERPSILRYKYIACTFLLLRTIILLCSLLLPPELPSNTDSVKYTYTAVSSLDDTASKEGMITEWGIISV
jgi:hypothetical protein